MERFKIAKVSLSLIALLITLVTTGLLLKTIIFDDYSRVILSNSLKNNVPAGEIVYGMIIKQIIDLPEEVDNELACIEILMATYARSNNSQIEISLMQNGKKERIILNTSYLRDNNYVKVCFNNTYFKPGKAQLEIKGLDGVPGNAVTAWLTEDTIFDLVTINDEIKKYNLVVKLGIKTEEIPAYSFKGGKTVFWVWVLSYIGTFIVMVLFFKPEQMKQEPNSDGFNN